jgi:hypothetical protein
MELNQQFYFKQQPKEVRILRAAIKIFENEPDETNRKDSYILSIIRRECASDWLSHKRICASLPKCFYALSFRWSKQETIDRLTSVIKVLNFKYGQYC